MNAQANPTFAAPSVTTRGGKEVVAGWPSRHIISAAEFSAQTLIDFFQFVRMVEDAWTRLQLGNEKDWHAFVANHGVQGKRMHSLFFESSTRTRATFHEAWHCLGGVITFAIDGGKSSSMRKGESFPHTIRALAGLNPDAMVIRSPINGAAQIAAEEVAATKVAIVNAGDGTNEHPTQALLDCYTIWDMLEGIEGLSIALGGDVLNSRTIHSLLLLLSKFPGVKVYLCAPKLLQLDAARQASLTNGGVKLHLVEKDWRDLIASRQIHVFYQTRLQTERFRSPLGLWRAKLLQRHHTITEQDGLLMKRKHIYLMHPGPIVDSIDPLCDRFGTSIYLKQWQNGFFVRTADLALRLGKKQSSIA